MAWIETRGRRTPVAAATPAAAPDYRRSGRPRSGRCPARSSTGFSPRSTSPTGHWSSCWSPPACAAARSPGCGSVTSTSSAPAPSARSWPSSGRCNAARRATTGSTGRSPAPAHLRRVAAARPPDHRQLYKISRWLGHESYAFSADRSTDGTACKVPLQCDGLGRATTRGRGRSQRGLVGTCRLRKASWSATTCSNSCPV